MEFDEYEYLEKAVEEKVETEPKKTREKQREKEVVDDDRRRRRRGEEEEDNNGVGRESKRREKDGKREKEERERGDRRDRDRDRDKDRERKEKEREREKEKERRERRSSSRSRHERERERELRDREFREKDSRRYKEKKEAGEPVSDPERDQRTVFAYQMPLKATERDVFEFFSKAGKVRDVRLIMDRSSRRSKGVGYIEFVDVMTVPMAIAMSGQLLLGQPVMVKPSEAEKNLVQPTASAAGGSSATGPTDRKLYVGNLHYNMTEQQLRQIFEPFGPVELIQLPLDPDTGHCKGFGFIQFSQAEHAKTAVSLNGKLDIAGRYIKVSSVTDHVSAQEVGTTAADFDDDDGVGLSLNAQSRALLMQKLDRTGTTTSIGGTMGVPMGNGSFPIQHPMTLPLNGQAGIPTPTLSAQVLPTAVTEPVGTPSECLLLKNLFDPATEADPEFDLDIKDDVSEECSKFGEVRHIYVDKHSAGHVYLRFGSKEAAMNAQRQMHLRWFAQKLISAVFMPPQDYDAKFRDSA